MDPIESNRYDANCTIVVNWKERGFGCAKNCSYCNWRESPMLPNGPHSEEKVRAFVRKCGKSFVTISGGGDPMYRFDENRDSLVALADTIRREGYLVRMITREVARLPELKGIVNLFSISLDSDVMQEVFTNREKLVDLDVEFSLVLPPLPHEDIVRLMPQYVSLRHRLGRRLVLRENLNSLFKLDFENLSTRDGSIVFVSKQLCLSGKYLSREETYGWDLVQDNRILFNEIAGPSAPNGITIFGGAVRHLVHPAGNPEYDDIDVLVTDGAFDELESILSKFEYSVSERSLSSTNPRYYSAKSSRAGKPVQIVRVRSEEDARKFVDNAQYDIDRVSYKKGKFVNLTKEIEAAIKQKTATLVEGARSMDLFQPGRQQVEQRHRAKLLRKGYKIIEKETE